jgi:hypothetical protein
MNGSVGIATGYGLDGKGSIHGRGKIFFFFSIASTRALETHPAPIQRVPWALFPRLERHGREADHSPPSSKVKNDGAIPSLPHTS